MVVLLVASVACVAASAICGLFVATCSQKSKTSSRTSDKRHRRKEHRSKSNPKKDLRKPLLHQQPINRTTLRRPQHTDSDTTPINTVNIEDIQRKLTQFPEQSQKAKEVVPLDPIAAEKKIMEIKQGKTVPRRQPEYRTLTGLSSSIWDSTIKSTSDKADAAKQALDYRKALAEPRGKP